jgi:HEAT repeat protein
MSPRILPLVALVVCLVQPAVARAQLTGEELALFNKMLAEPDAKASYEKRLKLIGDAIEREGDLKRRPSTSYQVDLKQARIPAAEGSPFLLQRLDQQSEIVKRTTLRMLGAYGADAKSAVPKLLQLMNFDPISGVRADAMLTLAKVDPNNVETAAAILEKLGAAGSDDSTNRAVLQALIPMAAVVPKSAVPRIAKFQDHRWTEMGIYAHELIGKVLAVERPTLDQLRTMETIDWRDASDQGYAILATIAEAGPKADFAMPLVVELLISGPPPYLECVALEALGKVKTGNPRIISALLDRLAAKDLLVRHKARLALMLVDLKEPASVRALAKGLRHGDRLVRFEAAVTLRNWDQMAKLTPAGHAEMLAPLLETLGEANEELPTGQLDVYLSLLRRFGTKALPVADAMVKLYQAEGYFKKQGPYGAQMRGKILAVLANVGVPEPARPLLMEALQKGPTHESDAGYAYAAAAHAVAAFGAAVAEPKQAVPLLLPALKVKGKEREFYFIDWSGDGLGRPTSARLEAIRALAKMGPDAKDALPLLRDIAQSEGGRPGSIDLAVQEEARRAFRAIVEQAGENGTEKLPFVDGKRDFLHLDERLHVKLNLQLRNPRPQDVLKRLQEATNLIFTMDENVDTTTPVWSSTHMHQITAENVMRQLVKSPNVQGTWEDVGNGYRLVGKKKTSNQGPPKTSKAPFPPFRDDSNNPMAEDPRLQVMVTIQLQNVRVPDMLRLIEKATGVTLTAERVDTDTPIFAGLNSPNTEAWRALRDLAEAKRVDGTWEKVGDGYRLRGKYSPPPAVVRAVPVQIAPVPAAPVEAAPSTRLWVALAFGGFLTILLCLALAWRLREWRAD